MTFLVSFLLKNNAFPAYSPSPFGVKIPAVNAPRTCFELSLRLIFLIELDLEIKSIKNFINEKADKYKMGDKINEQTVLLKQDLDNFENVGKAYKFQLVNGNKIYHSLFLFTESEKGYLWIIFTATPETFNINLEKFKLFLKNLKINI